MKLYIQVAVAAIAAALLAGAASAQTSKEGPLPPTGTPSEYQAPAQGTSSQNMRHTRARAGKGIHHASSQSVKDLQGALNSKDSAGLKVDGVMGPKTRGALKKYQSANNLKATGRIDAQTRTKLGLSTASSSRSSSAMPSANSSSTPSSGSRAISPSQPSKM